MSSNLEQTEQRIKKVIADTLKVDESLVTKESTIADLGGDSLAALRILSALEQEFDISLSDEDDDLVSVFVPEIKSVKPKPVGSDFSVDTSFVSTSGMVSSF